MTTKKQSAVAKAAEAFLDEFCWGCDPRTKRWCREHGMAMCSSEATGFRAVPVLRRAVLAARKGRKGKRIPGIDDAFVRHIQGHLRSGQQVVCKICGKTATEIRDAARKARAKKGGAK